MYSLSRPHILRWSAAWALAVVMGQWTPAVAADPPVTNLTVPTISGTARVDADLDATDGTWDPADSSYTYQWWADGAPIPGATTDTYTPKPADVGKTLRVKVTAHKTGYTSTTKGSALTAAVVKAKFSSAGVSTIDGTAGVCEVLTANPHSGGWSPMPTSYKYQWFANGTAITSATAANFTVGVKRAGKAITVQVTGKRNGYNGKTVTSNQVVIPDDTVTPVTPAVGDGAANGWTLDEARYRILTDTNSFREQNGKPVLTLARELNCVAQTWTKHMATANIFQHNPLFASQYPTGWTGVAENIAAGYAPSTVVEAWKNSDGHRANMLGNYDTLGIGYILYPPGQYDTYFTQNFGKY